jgi:hypothetical protein
VLSSEGLWEDVEVLRSEYTIKRGLCLHSTFCGKREADRRRGLVGKKFFNPRIFEGVPASSKVGGAQ